MSIASETDRTESVSRFLEALDRVAEIDLSMVRLKLLNPDTGEPRAEGEIDHFIEEYRKFIALQMALPGERHVPSLSADTVWHQHILDTRAYHRDCEKLFGGYLHHYPYFGLSGAADRRQLEDAFERTNDLLSALAGAERCAVSGDPSARCSRCSSCSRCGPPG